MFTQSGKTGDDKGESKYQTPPPKETLTTSPAMIVGEKSTMQEKVNAPPKISSKSIHNNQGRLNKENMGTNLLMEEDKKQW